MSLTVKHIRQEFTAQSWGLVESYIKEAMKWGHGDSTLDQVKMYVTLGQWVLLAVFDEEGKIHGACTVSFLNYPNDRVAFITAIGGKLISNKDTFSQLSTILKAFGATKIQGAARESVARLWKRYGFNERSVIVETKI